MYDHYFSNFGSSPVPEDICKDSAIRHARVWRRRFLKVFPIQMHREANLTLPFVCVEVLRPSQPNEVMSSAVSLPNHTFTGQA